MSRKCCTSRRCCHDECRCDCGCGCGSGFGGSGIIILIIIIILFAGCNNRRGFLVV